MSIQITGGQLSTSGGTMTGALAITPSSAPALTLRGVAASDQPVFGAEFLGASGWTSADWTGDWATGWAHTTGNVSVLSHATAAVSATKYQIAYTVTGRTAGSFTLAFGGQSVASVTATGAFGPKTTSTAALTITPTSDFNGTIVLSIKAITAGSTALMTLADSGGTSRNEVRAGAANATAIGISAGLYNTTGTLTAVGYYAGLYNTTGYLTAVGHSAGYSNTTGTLTAVGHQAGLNNTTGTLTAVGYLAGQSNTTGNLTAVGHQAGYSNTTGTLTAVGYLAGCYLADGATANATSAGNLYLGASTRSGAASSANEIVIGDNAIGLGSGTCVIGTGLTLTAISGRVGVDGVTAPTAALHVPASSTARASLRVPDGTAPTTPNDGDIWAVSGHIYARVGGVTKEFTLV